MTSVAILCAVQVRNAIQGNDLNLQPSLGTDSGVAVTVIEAVADVGVALALLEPKLC